MSVGQDFLLCEKIKNEPFEKLRQYISVRAKTLEST